MAVIKYWNESTKEWLPVNVAPQMVQTAFNALNLAGYPAERVFTDDKVATTAQAQAGTDNATVMTPLRTKEAILSLSPPTVKATQAQAQAGTSNDVFMTPLRTKEAIQALAPQVNKIGNCELKYNTSTKSLDFVFI